VRETSALGQEGERQLSGKAIGNRKTRSRPISDIRDRNLAGPKLSLAPTSSDPGAKIELLQNAAGWSRASLAEGALKFLGPPSSAARHGPAV
jgi:hypothetical protein